MNGFCSILQRRDIRNILRHSCVFVLFSALILPRSLFAYTQYCDITELQSHVVLSYSKQEKSRLDSDNDAEVSMTGSGANLSWLISNRQEHSYSLGFHSLYTILDFDSISPMTNGHLHTWGFPYSGHYKKHGADIFYAISPVLSVSSNALKNPEIINSESFRLETRIIYQNKFLVNPTWVYGLIADSRFGDYRLYPLAGLCWNPTDSWLLQLALPDFILQKSFSPGMKLSFYMAPEGNSWHVFSRDRQASSELTYNSMVTGISAEWTFKPAVKLSLELEKQTDREFNLVLDDNSTVNPDAGSSTQLKLTAKILF